MTFLPIVARELRVAARRRAVYWNRVGAALLGVLLSTLVYANAAPAGYAELGYSLFASLAWLAFVFCALSGARLTADAISEERREGTLGLLFLTDLRGYDIVLGKLAASSISALYSLLAIVPILGMSLLFGGVSGSQFWLAVIVLVNTMFASLAVGILVSCCFENGRRAALVTVVFQLALVIGPWIALAIFENRHSSPPGPRSPAFELTTPSPATALLIATLPANALPLSSFGGLFWPSVTTLFGLGLVSLGLASLIVPRVWHDRPASSWRMRWRRLREEWAYGKPGPRHAFRQRLLAVNPFYWLTSRDRLKPRYVWFMFTAAAAVWCWAWGEIGNDWLEPGVQWMCAYALAGVLKFWIAAAVVVRLAEDRRAGALELLLTTPLVLRDITAGLGHSLRRQFLAPGIALLVLTAGFYFGTAGHVLGDDYSDHFLMFAMYVAVPAFLALDAFTLWRLGPWVAVSTPQPNQAAANLLVRVCVAPWVIFLGGTFVLAVAENWGLLRLNIKPDQAFGLWCALGVANDVFWLTQARRHLKRHFRAAAAARFAPKAGRWWRALVRMN